MHLPPLVIGGGGRGGEGWVVEGNFNGRLEVVELLSQIVGKIKR